LLFVDQRIKPPILTTFQVLPPLHRYIPLHSHSFMRPALSMPVRHSPNHNSSYQAPTPFISIFGSSPLFNQAISYPPFFQNSTSTSLSAFHSSSFGFVPSDRSIGRFFRFFFLVPAASLSTHHRITGLLALYSRKLHAVVVLYSLHHDTAHEQITRSAFVYLPAYILTKYITRIK